MPQSSILVIEDHVPTREALVQVLRYQGYIAKGVASSVECLKLLDEGDRFDLLVVDLFMPSLSGFGSGKWRGNGGMIKTFSTSAAFVTRFRRMSLSAQARQS